MDSILIILKKENGPRASSAPSLGLNTIIFKHVYWYMQQTQVSVYRTIGPLVLSSRIRGGSGFYTVYVFGLGGGAWGWGRLGAAISCGKQAGASQGDCSFGKHVLL